MSLSQLTRTHTCTQTQTAPWCPSSPSPGRTDHTTSLQINHCDDSVRGKEKKKAEIKKPTGACQGYKSRGRQCLTQTASLKGSVSPDSRTRWSSPAFNAIVCSNLWGEKKKKIYKKYIYIYGRRNRENPAVFSDLNVIF